MENNSKSLNIGFINFSLRQGLYCIKGVLLSYTVDIN